MTEKTDPTPDEKPKKADVRPKNGVDPVLLKGEIKIFPDQRLPSHDQAAVKAYKASGADGKKAFAMLCEKNVVPQAEIVHKYMGLMTPLVPKLIACGVVDWSPDNSERFAFVYEDTLGNPISLGKNPAALGLKGELVVSTVLRNLLDVVSLMHDNAIIHGNIRVQNIFDGGSATLEASVLGEMLSTPAGYAQPVIYETIPRALASPLGRGMADFSDDIYSLGVTVALLMHTHDPAEGMSDEEIIMHKIEQGSFNFITGKDRFPGAILEFLRGTLNDDPVLRWTFDDIKTWLDGRRVSAKAGGMLNSLKASRPIEFGRKKYLRPQGLAIALPNDPSQTVPLVENGELFLWLNRSLQDKECETRFEEAQEEAKKASGGSSHTDRLTSAVAIALAPEHPIFYRDLKFNPAGFGNILIDAVYNKKDMTPFVDIIRGSLVLFWNKCNKVQGVGVGDVINRIENCQRFISQTIIGYGLERCVYYLNPMAPCLSDKLSNFYVRSAEDYLNALEKLSSSKDRPEWFLDRHIVAFLSVRDKSVIEPFLSDIAASERYRQRQGVLKVLASIQRRDKMRDLPGLSSWIGGMVDILVDRYHDREYRVKVREQLAKIKDKGSLDKLAALFDNYDEIQQDMKNYTAAMQQYQALRSEYFRLQNELDTNTQFGMGAGKQVATMVSGIIAALVVVIYLVFTMSSGGAGRIF